MASVRAIQIHYDHEIFCAQRVGGISRYFTELARSVSRQGSNARIVAGFHVNEYASRSDYAVGCRFPRFSGIERLRERTNRVLQAAYCRMSPPDVLHLTYYSSKLTCQGAAVVTTIHDMSYERLLGREHPLSRRKAEHCTRADAVLTISQATRRDLLNFYDVNPSKVYVTPLGSSIDEVTASEPTPIEQPYLLYVGNRGWYKNFVRLAKAYASKPHIRNSFKLVCFGGGAFTSEEQLLLSTLGIERRLRHINGHDSVLKALYLGARAMVMPSCLEGFGLPLLEAMILGCPIICSDTTSLPEVAGDAATYFEPESEDSILAAIEHTVFDDSKLKEMSRRGRVRSGQFSWERCAEETLIAYRKAIGNVG